MQKIYLWWKNSKLQNINNRRALPAAHIVHYLQKFFFAWMSFFRRNSLASQAKGSSFVSSELYIDDNITSDEKRNNICQLITHFPPPLLPDLGALIPERLSWRSGGGPKFVPTIKIVIQKLSFINSWWNNLTSFGLSSNDDRISRQHLRNENQNVNSTSNKSIVENDLPVSQFL